MQNAAEPRLHEIIARTVTASGREQVEKKCLLHAADRPEKLLGVTVVPRNTRAARKNGRVTASGSFEVHVWYAHTNSQQTSVLKQTFTFEEEVTLIDHVSDPVGEPQVQVTLTEIPRVASCHITPDGQFQVTVELEVEVELVGDARLRVPVYAAPNGDAPTFPAVQPEFLADDNAAVDDLFEDDDLEPAHDFD